MAWDSKAQVAVVGPTGVVGREILAALEERGHSPDKLSLLGSARAEGEELDYLGETVQVERLEDDSFRGMQVVLLATPAALSRELAFKAQGAGAWVVDTSTAFRGEPGVPVVLPEVNAAALRAAFKGRVVCIPGPVMTAVALAIEPLRTDPGVSRVRLTALLGASAGGSRGIDELEKQTAGLLSGRELEPAAFPHRAAFNLIPQVGEFGSDLWSSEERGWGVEAEKLWAAQANRPTVFGTAIQAPIFYGAFVSVTAELRAPTGLEEIRERWRREKTLKVLDAPAERVYPMPMLVTADSTVHVGRLRAFPDAPASIAFAAAVDNAGRGSAVTAVEVAELLLAR